MASNGTSADLCRALKVESRTSNKEFRSLGLSHWYTIHMSAPGFQRYFTFLYATSDEMPRLNEVAILSVNSDSLESCDLLSISVS